MSNESGVPSNFTQPCLQMCSLQKHEPFVRMKEFFGRFVRNRNSCGGAPEGCMKGYCAWAYNQLQIIHKLYNSLSWEETSCSAAQEILSSLLYRCGKLTSFFICMHSYKKRKLACRTLYLMVHYNVHISQSLSWIRWIPSTFSFYFSKIRFNIIVLSLCLFSLRFSIYI
jgi:hypothetical protein